MLLTSVSVADAGLGRLPRERPSVCPGVDLSSPDQRLSAYLHTVLSWCPKMRQEIVELAASASEGRKAAGQGQISPL